MPEGETLRVVKNDTGKLVEVELVYSQPSEPETDKLADALAEIERLKAELAKTEMVSVWPELTVTMRNKATGEPIDFASHELFALRPVDKGEVE